MRFCSSLEADVQFLGVLTLLDGEGSSLRVFSDSQILRKIFHVPPFGDDPVSLEALEDLLVSRDQQSFDAILLERPVKAGQRPDVMVRFNLEFACPAGELQATTTLANLSPRRRRK
jgi:hypothetical protein